LIHQYKFNIKCIADAKNQDIEMYTFSIAFVNKKRSTADIKIYDFHKIQAM